MMRTNLSGLLLAAVVSGLGVAAGCSSSSGGGNGGTGDAGSSGGGDDGGSSGGSSGGSGGSSGGSGSSSGSASSSSGGSGGSSGSSGGSSGGSGSSSGGDSGPAPCAGVDAGGHCLVTIATGQAYPQWIAVDGTDAYWTAGTALMKAPLGGGGTPAQVGMALTSGSGLAVNATNAYVGDQGATQGTIWKIALASGTTTALASSLASTPAAVASDANNVYWYQCDGTIWQVSIAGGTPTQLASGQAMCPQAGWGIAVDSQNVYWGDLAAGGMMSAPIGGGSAASALGSGQGASFFALDATSVYWSHTTSVLQQPRAGGTVVTLSNAESKAAGIIADAQNVYWADQTGKALRMAPIGSTGMVTTLWTSATEQPYPLAQDASHVYWATFDSGNSLKGNIYSISK